MQNSVAPPCKKENISKSTPHQTRSSTSSLLLPHSFRETEPQPAGVSEKTFQAGLMASIVTIETHKQLHAVFFLQDKVEIDWQLWSVSLTGLDSQSSETLLSDSNEAEHITLSPWLFWPLCFPAVTNSAPLQQSLKKNFTQICTIPLELWVKIVVNDLVLLWTRKIGYQRQSKILLWQSNVVFFSFFWCSFKLIFWLISQQLFVCIAANSKHQNRHSSLFLYFVFFYY